MRMLGGQAVGILGACGLCWSKDYHKASLFAGQSGDTAMASGVGWIESRYLVLFVTVVCRTY